MGDDKLLTTLERKRLREAKSQVEEATKQLDIQEAQIKSVSIPTQPQRRFGMSLSRIQQEQRRIADIKRQREQGLKEIQKARQQVEKFRSKTVGILLDIARKRAEQRGRMRETIARQEILTGIKPTQLDPKQFDKFVKNIKDLGGKVVIKSQGLSIQNIGKSDIEKAEKLALGIKKIKKDIPTTKLFDRVSETKVSIKKPTPIKPTPIITKISETNIRELNRLRNEKLKLFEKAKNRELNLFELKRINTIDKKLAERGFAQSFISAGIGVLLLPELIAEIREDPKQFITSIPTKIKEGIIKGVKIAAISPTEAVARIGAEVVLLKGFGKGFKVIGKLKGKGIAKVSGKLKKVKGKKIIIDKIGKATTLEIITKPATKIGVPIKKQAELIGKKLPIVTSAQADRLLTFVKRKRIIRKPIPNEAKLKKRTKKLLNKFDVGKISNKEFIELETSINLETGNSLLERSFFVSPEATIRTRRLGIQKEASLLDILTGKFTFRTQKPQVLIFKDIKVAKFPKTKIFKSIKNKLKQKGKPNLTKKEAEALLKFQLKPTGRFKPIGALSREPELTLAPNEIIKKVKTLAKFEFDGRIIPIVEAKVVRATKKTSKLIRKAKTGKATRKDLRQLRKNLKKETGFKNPTVSRRKLGKPLVRPSRLIGVAKPRIRPRISPKPSIRPRPKPTKRISPKPSIRPRPKPTKRISPKPPTRPKPKPPTRPSARPRPPIKPIAKEIIPITPTIKRKKKKPKRKEAKSYDVFARPLKKKGAKKKPKLIKINKRPLSKTDATKLGSAIVDTSLSRTFKLKPSTMKPKKPTFKVKAPSMKKFRTFKQVKGVKRKLKHTFIEKSKHLLDTKSEKRGITLKRRIAQLQPRKIQRPKRRITQAQRQILLQRLKKARAVLNKWRK